MAETAALLKTYCRTTVAAMGFVADARAADSFATDPKALTQVVGMYRTNSRHLLHKAGARPQQWRHRRSEAGAALRFVANLNEHFYMPFLDGVYVSDGTGQPVFRHFAGPDPNELQAFVEQIASRFGRVLQRLGLVERAIETLGSPGMAKAARRMICWTLRSPIGSFVGPRAGQKLFRLQTVPPAAGPKRRSERTPRQFLVNVTSSFSLA